MKLWHSLKYKPIYLFTFILLLKGALAWFVIFDNGPSWMTVLTEIPFLLVLFCLIEIFATKRKILYYMLVNLSVTLLYFAVLMYYKYYGIIVTYHALEQADKVTKVGESTYSLMDPYYLLIFIDIIIFGIAMLRPKYRPEIRRISAIRTNRMVALGALVASVVLCLFNIWPNHASMNENKKAQGMGILNYEVYTIFADSTERDEVIPMSEINQESIDQLKGLQSPSVTLYKGAAQGKNLIVVQMESFQNFLLGLTIDGQEITPNLNKLYSSEFYFPNFYTSVGQGTTSDAEFVVNTSLYVPHHEAATSSNYMDKSLPSLPKLMKSQGYDTATFHTNSVDFWNRLSLYTALGFDRYYDKTFFGDDDHLAFGASDEVLFSKTASKLAEMDKGENPFYTMVISMSSHHPYKLPEEKERIKLPEQFDGTLVGRYLVAQNYSDYALGQFIDDLKAKGLWDDSVVVFYGDHQGLPLYSLSSNEKDLMKGLFGRDYGYTDMFNIPLIIHAPGVSYAATFPQTGGQIDILPTVANLMGAPLEEQLHFGEDLFNQHTNILPMRHFLPTGSFLNDTSLFLPGISYEDGTNYGIADNQISAGGSTQNQYDAALRLLNMSDSYAKQLPELPKDGTSGPARGN